MDRLTAIVYLMGYPGVGKRTVGAALADQLDGVLVDNQLINVPILTVFKWDGKFMLPPGVFERARPIRRAVLDTIDALAPRSNSYVFTNDPTLDDPHSAEDYEELKTLADRRQSVFQAVRVICDEDEMVRRIDTPDRRARLKGSDPEGYRWHRRSVELFWPPEPELLTVDTTTSSPEESATFIRTHIGFADARESP